jgi:hypothetical protein
LPFKTVARVLNLPAAPAIASSTAAATISAVTTAPFSALYLDGVSQGVRPTPRNARGEIETTDWPFKEAVASAVVGGNCSFPVNASGVQCHDLHRASNGDKSAEACAAACCAEGGECNTWQLQVSSGSACWIGRAGEGVGKCGLPKKGSWIGGQRTTPGPSPTPPPAPYTPYRNATIVAYSGDPAEVSATGTAGTPVKVLATHSLFAPSGDVSGYKLQLTIDVPSAGTGTGGALLLDGRDTALVRCAIVDSNSHDALVSNASERVTWSVVGGAGRLAGTSNGNTTSLEWMKSPSIHTYLGLARGLFRVTQDCTSVGRANCATIDGDVGPTEVNAKIADCNTNPIVVEASVPGFATVTISIPVSVDAAKDGVMAVARATGSSFTGGFSYLDDFVG